MMNFDFELLLVIFLAIFGLVWIVDVAWWKRARMEKLQQQTTEQLGSIATDKQLATATMPLVVEYSRAFFPILAIVLVLRGFVYEPYQIPSGSMLPGLQIGDFIIVDKHTYGLRLPVLGTKIVNNNEPQRGDVMVFKFPYEPAKKYIKRVIGLPGDSIYYKNKQLFINEQPVPQEYVAMDISGNKIYRESFAGEEHLIWQNPHTGRSQWRLPQTVPEGHYFMMGDNRDSSSDSRVWGFVSDDLIVGEAVAVWMQWKTLFSLPNFSTAGAIE